MLSTWLELVDMLSVGVMVMFIVWVRVITYQIAENRRNMRKPSIFHVHVTQVPLPVFFALFRQEVSSANIPRATGEPQQTSTV